MTEHKEVIHPLCYTIAGISSGVVARAVGQPLDVLKIRFQLQDYKGGHLKYTSVIRATSLICREEGVLGLWKGHIPAQVLSVIYGVVQFNTFEFARNYVYKHFPTCKTDLYLKTLTDFLCGGASGVAATVVCQPFDVLRTRLIAQKNQMYYSIWHGLKDMSKENGFRTFFKGLVPTLCMVFPYIGFHFSFYGLFKYSWLATFKWDHHNKPSLLVCGAASGVCSKLILLPFDMVKKRLQVVGFQNNTSYNGMIDCFRKIVKEQGATALYRGASPSMIKAGFVTAVSFLVYEHTIEYCSKSKISRTFIAPSS